MLKSEKFVVFGATALAARCIEFILERKHSIVAILTEDPWLREWASKQNLPVKEILEEGEGFDCLLSIANPLIIPKWILEKSKTLSINYHDSPLPAYAGVYATSWALLNREKIHGITWHEITNKIDAGDILKQAHFAIDLNETAFSLNVKCYEHAYQAFRELLIEIEEDRVARIPQDLSKRTYFGLNKEPPNRAIISWNESAEELQSLFAALDFGHYENRFGVPKIIYRKQFLYPKTIQVLESSTKPPGTVTAVADSGLQVATKTRDVFMTFEGKEHEALGIEVGELLSVTGGFVKKESDFCLVQEDCIQMFEKSAQSVPDKIAVVFEGSQIDYKTLDLRSNQLGNYLLKKNFGKDALIGICLERSIDVVIAILAVLKARLAYLPIDPNLPDQRIRYMLEDSKVGMVISRISLDQDKELISKEDQNGLSIQSGPDPLAYILYTSGSTGHPKGVEVYRSSLNNLFAAFQNQFPSGAQDRWLALASLSFDLSMLEILFPLTQGATLVLTDHETTKDPFLLSSELSEEKGITVAIGTPAIWQMLIDAGWKENHFLTIFSGGEALSNILAEALLRRCKALWNLYGPTETTIFSSIKKIENARDKITIGHPILNTSYHILDDKKRPAPFGMPGELYIGGAGLARGYRNKPMLTEQAFVFVSSLGGKLYRTGDLVRYMPNYDVEFLGRLDNQVKLHGNRIELGEIEEVIRQSPEVKQCVCSLRENKGQKRLAAYYTGACTEESLKQILKLHLPTYMIPSAFIWLERMPLTFNGKIDRKMLPEPFYKDEEIAFPNSGIESEIAGIFGEILGLEKFSCSRSFISLGGNSLSAIKVLSRINKMFQLSLTLKIFFENSSVSLIAKHVEASRQIGYREKTIRHAQTPLSDSQMRFWLLQKLHGNSPLYNVPLTLNICADNLDLGAFEKALHAIVKRHEILRTYFTESTNGPVQSVYPDSEFEMEFLDLSLEVSPEVKAQELLLQELKRVFDLSAYPLFHFLLIRMSKRRYAFCFHVHHILFDGNSVPIFLKELKSLYEAFLLNHPDPLPPIAHQYIDLMKETSVSEQKQLDWWVQKLKDPSSLSIPYNKKQPVQQTFVGSIVEFSIGKDEIEGIKKISQATETTVFSLFLSLFYVLLYRYSDQCDRVIGIPVSNRRLADEENLIGCFINTLPLRILLNGEETFLEILNIVKKEVMDAIEHQDVSFEKIARQFQNTPLFQIMFNMLPPIDEAESGNLRFSFQAIDRGLSHFDLSLSLQETKGHWIGIFEYNTDLFLKEAIEQMCIHFKNLLQEVIVNPELRINKFLMLSEKEIDLLSHHWAQSFLEYPKEETILQAIEKWVISTPHSPAVICGKAHYSFAEMNALSNKIAHGLAAFGIPAGGKVVIHLERSAEFIAAVLGVLKAGGAFIPLDVATPEGRVRSILQEVNPFYIIDALDNFADFPSETCFKDIVPDQTAYCIYTSGSTGVPKGIEIDHRGINDRVFWKQAAYPLDLGDVTLHTYSFSFDGAPLSITCGLYALEQRLLYQQMKNK